MLYDNTYCLMSIYVQCIHLQPSVKVSESFNQTKAEKKKSSPNDDRRHQ